MWPHPPRPHVLLFLWETSLNHFSTAGDCWYHIPPPSKQRLAQVSVGQTSVYALDENGKLAPCCFPMGRGQGASGLSKGSEGKSHELGPPKRVSPSVLAPAWPWSTSKPSPCQYRWRQDLGAVARPGPQELGVEQHCPRPRWHLFAKLARRLCCPGQGPGRPPCSPAATGAVMRGQTAASRPASRKLFPTQSSALCQVSFVLSLCLGAGRGCSLPSTME